MFKLEHALTQRRPQMAQAGIEQPAVVDELESHLRDEVEAQVRAGVHAQDAFDAAVQRIGQPTSLKHEFAATLTVFDRFKDLLLTLTGIPNYNLATSMNTPRIEPAWATYLKATTFLLPAIFLATISAIWVVPKLQQICRDAGLPAATAGTFWNLTHSSIQVMLVLLHRGVFIAGVAVLLLFLLEWQFTAWPRYRRAAIGLSAFVLNTIILLAFFMMFLAAILAAPALSGLPK
jgi:hypothetical protein